MYDKNNIFAKILREEIPCNKVSEGEHYLAFHDAFPKADIHILVIPKKDYITYHDFLEDASPEEKIEFFDAIVQIVKEYELDKKGYKLHNNNLKGGGQEVPHFHMHILGWHEEDPDRARRHVKLL